MTERSVVIIGLPGSGKTTFLGALWHIVTQREIETSFRFHNLRSGDLAHLNAIASRWREARIQERTAVSGNKVVSMNLLDSKGGGVRITFPDIAGEAYRRMWEERACDPEVAELLQKRSVILFVHADTIRAPQWVVDEAELSRKLGLPVAQGEEVAWHPRFAPTQVQIVGLLQLLREPPLDIGARRLAVMLSAWDKVASEGLGSEAYLHAKLPLLSQYLRNAADAWEWRVYGLSAQGGEYDSAKDGALQSPEAEMLRSFDQPSRRIRLLHGNTETHDLTEPFAWLME